MSTRFRAYQPDQILLMPPKLRDWVPEGHLAHQVSDLVDSLDLSAFYAPYEGDGRRNAPYSPRLLSKVLVYGYVTGVCPLRGIARKLEEDVASRMLGAGNFPKHQTICEFRRRHLSAFRALFLQMVRLSRELGLVRFGTLSVDGDEGPGAGEQAEGDELRADVGGGVEAFGGDRGVVGDGGTVGRGGGRALRGGGSWRRDPGGVAASGGSAGGDPGGEGAVGGAAAADG